MTAVASSFPDERFRVTAGRAIGVLSILFGLYALIVLPAVGLWRVLVEDFIPHSVLMSVGFGVFALLAVPRQPFNNSVWVAVWGGLISGIAIAGYASAYLVIANEFGIDLDVLGRLAPADVSPLAGILYLFIGGVGLSFLLIVGVGLLLFPEGQLPSSRWRLVVWGSVVTAIGFAVAIAHEFRPSSSTPFGAGSDRWTGAGRYIEVIMLVWIAFLAISFISAVNRYRHSDGAVRQQYRWIGLGCGLFIVALLVVAATPGGFVADLGEDPVKWLAALIGIAGILAGYAIAVGKYRLYDIDVVISRTLVYGSLALFISTVYVGIVVGAGQVLQVGDTADLWLGIAATVVIAIAFQPLRRRLQRVANRMVYGRRATPYEVLSSFSQQIAATDPGVLGQVARMLTEGTTASAASIWVVRRQGFHRIAAFPDTATDDRVAHDSPIPRADQTAEVIHDGERLGLVALELPAGQPFPPTDRMLLDQVAAGLGLALRNLQLTDDLRTRVDELRESRRRVVAVQDQTRQMLERDLHDGAQQRLVALKIKVGLGATIAQKQELAEVREILETVRSEADLTIESLRNLARGIYPPLLESEGLAAALTAQLRRAPLPVTVQAAGIRRQPREIEATVYFCVLEAVQNALKHARAKSVLVTVTNDDAYLEFEVRDDGIGFDLTQPSSGSGLQNMADRLDALNGAFEVAASPGHGTRVMGRIPVRQVAAV